MLHAKKARIKNKSLTIFPLLQSLITPQILKNLSIKADDELIEHKTKAVLYFFFFFFVPPQSTQI
jgi:hypothetical protein